ncbi:MAG: LamG-like jellyroll fold domain-containing protein, partial [Saprospiraceae bacterium]
MKKHILFYLVFLCLAGALGTLQAQAVRYIRIAQNSSGASDILHLAEIRAIQKGTGTNLALNKAVTTDSQGASLAKANYVDGDTTTAGGSAVAGKAGYVEIDLGAAYDLARIEIVNRYAASENLAQRARNLQLTLKDADGEVSSNAINAYQGKNAAWTTYWYQFERSSVLSLSQGCPTASSSPLLLRNNCAGNALRFKGTTGQAISIPSTLPIGNRDFTVEMWVKVPVVGEGGLDASEPVGRLMSTSISGGFVNWAINENGQLSIRWGDLTAAGTTDLRDGKWHHILFSRDKAADTYQGFLDGNLELSAASAGSDVSFDADKLRIGVSSSADAIFHGLIDELRIWNVRKEDIPGHNPYQEVHPSSALELYYRFNEAADSLVYDYSLAGRHGVLSDSLSSAQDTRTSEAPAPLAFASVLWSTGGTDTSITANANGKYWVTANLGGGLVRTDTFDLTLPALLQEADCGSVMLKAVGGSTFTWANGRTLADTTVTANGTYTVSIGLEGCSAV